jgi:hypothetical protein
MSDPRAALDRSILLLQDYTDADDDAVVSALTKLRVRIAADEITLASTAGCAALLASFETVARLGVQAVLDLPDLEIALPPGYASGLSITSALIERSLRLITPATQSGDADLHLNLSEHVAPGELGLGGDDFTARLRLGESGGGWIGELPFGAGQAGAAAGAEVARAALRALLNGRPPLNPLALAHRPADLALPAFRLAEAPDLGRVDFVSAGAITHAVLFLLFQVPDLRMSSRVFDDDIAHLDNINRYYLLATDGLEQHKSQQLESLSNHRIIVRGVERRVTDESSLGDAAPLADKVCVGVDSIEGRWAAQTLAPRWLGVGATTHAYATASEHWPAEACAACLHPTPETLNPRLPTISFVSLWAGTLLAYRLVAGQVAGQRATESTTVLDAFNVAVPQAVITDRFSPSPTCPLGCSTPL